MIRLNSFCRRISMMSVAGLAAAIVSPATLAQQFQQETVTRFPAEPVPGGEYTNQIAVGDIDADGDLDLIFANGGNFNSAGAPQQLRTYINNGTGIFTDQSLTRVPGALFLARGAELGDIDGDGDLDMIVAQDFNRQPQLFTNDGAGNFTNVTLAQMPVMLLSSARGQFADVDNDGDLDIYLVHGGAVSRFGTDRGKLLINDGSGFFTDETLTRTPNESVIQPMDVIFGDLNGDFSLDMVIASRNPTALLTNAKRYNNNGAGVFTAGTMPSSRNNYSFDLGDFDGDGDLDLVGINAHNTSSGSELLARNGGTGTSGNFTALSALVSSTTDDNDSKFFDYDNDGDLDLLIGSLGSTERIYSNNGTGTYALQVGVIAAVSDSTMDIEVGDFTGDGRVDIVTAQGESGSFVNKIYINVGGAIDNRAPRIIRMEQLADALSADGPFHVRAVVYDDMTSDRGFWDRGVNLNYTVGDAAGPTQVPMRWVGNSMWRGTFPDLPGGSDVTYWVTATDYANNTGVGASRNFSILFPPCPGDIDGDQTVGVPDLLAVINAWGQAVTTHDVELIETSFVPNVTNARSGDTVLWTFVSGGIHTITSGPAEGGTPCTADGRFTTVISSGTWQYVIPNDFSGVIPYYCQPHCGQGMTGDINVAAFKEDVSGDGVVGVPDLLGVINAWGACPLK